MSWKVVAADGRERGPIGGRSIAEKWKAEWEAEGREFGAALCTAELMVCHDSGHRLSQNVKGGVPPRFAWS